MNRLKELRKNSGKTQKEVFEETGIPIRSIQNWENGKRQINLESAKQLADYFGVSIGYLLGHATVGDVMELATRVMTNQIELEDISDENTRKAVSNYINLNKGIAPNQPFKIDYSMLNAIEKIDDIKLINEMITDSMLANRILDRLKGYLMQSGIIDSEYNWEIERVMGWLIDLIDELYKQEAVLSGGNISSSSSNNYQGVDSIKSSDDESIDFR